MTRRQKEPLRPLTLAERQHLEHLARAQSAPATHVARAKALLAVAHGLSYTAAARAAGRRSGDAIAHLVARFNQEGLAALLLRHGGGPPAHYDAALRTQILTEAQRPPDREQDRTATWSLLTLRRVLRQQPALARVSTYTLWRVLHEAGWRWQRSRTWCPTGQVLRKGKYGWTIAKDRDAVAKKSSLNAPI
jgi:transposase